jgi:hypothetical protein
VQLAEASASLFTDPDVTAQLEDWIEGLRAQDGVRARREGEGENGATAEGLAWRWFGGGGAKGV